jgi:hypothetical protein
VKEKLKRKWGIQTEFQFWVIMLIFTLAGSTTVWIKRPVFQLLGVTAETNLALKFVLWLMVIFPSYQILLMFWGTLLGQFRFVWWFEKKMLRRMRLIKGDPREPAPGATL